jgi:hypothetical protein
METWHQQLCCLQKLDSKGVKSWLCSLSRLKDKKRDIDRFLKVTILIATPKIKWLIRKLKL